MRLQTTRQKVGFVLLMVLGLGAVVWLLAWRDMDPGFVVTYLVIMAIAAPVLWRAKYAAAEDQPGHRWPWWASSVLFLLAALSVVATRALHAPVGAAGVGMLVLVVGIAVKAWLENRPGTGDE